MKYSEHIAFFDREIQKLGCGPFQLTFESFLLALAEDGCDETTAACRIFASTLNWPEMSYRARIEACCRLSCARWWCEGMSDYDLDSEEEGQRLLEELLIEYWLDGGREGWIQVKLVNSHFNHPNEPA